MLKRLMLLSAPEISYYNRYAQNFQITETASSRIDQQLGEEIFQISKFLCRFTGIESTEGEF